MYIYMYVGLSMGSPYKKDVCKNKAWAELRGTRMLKVGLGWLKPNLKLTASKTEEQRKERLRISKD